MHRTRFIYKNRLYDLRMDHLYLPACTTLPWWYVYPKPIRNRCTDWSRRKTVIWCNRHHHCRRLKTILHDVLMESHLGCHNDEYKQFTLDRVINHARNSMDQDDEFIKIQAVEETLELYNELTSPKPLYFYWTD
jgi:hypothetical protein